MVLFVVLLKRVHVFQMKPKGVTIQMKALDEDSLTILFMLLLKRFFKFLAKKKKPKGVTTP